MNIVYLLSVFFIWIVPEVASQRLPSNERIIDCRIFGDGDYDYGHPCNSAFIRCKQGEPNNVLCDEGLIFDHEERICTAEETNEKCKINKQHQLGRWENDPESLRRENFRSREWRKEYEVNNECQGKPDSKIAYVNACNKQYFQCKNGTATADMCPNAFYFDEVHQSCDFYHKIKICRSISGAPPCWVLPLGTYGTDGETLYYECNEKFDIAEPKRCPPNTKYSTLWKMCLFSIL